MTQVSKSLESLYLSGEFQAALDLLEKNKGPWPVEQYHSIKGSLLLKLEDFPQARYHLEMAKFLGSEDPALDNNRIFVAGKLDPVAIKAEGEHWFYHYNSLPEWSIPSVLLGLFCLFFWILMRKRSGWKAWGMMLIAIGLMIGAHLYVQSHYAMAIAKAAVSVREGPSHIYSERILIPAGIKVVVSKENTGHYLIVAPKIYAGWADAQDFYWPKK